MKLRDIYRTHIASQKTPVISFEVFPPQNSWETLDKELTILKKYNPALISVTSTSSATNCEQNKLVQNIQNTLQVSVMPHLTCMRNTRKDVEEYLDSLDTKRSPYYYTSRLVVAQKYLSEGDKSSANKWLDVIINDDEAPAMISANAQALR